jgi:hypothetical protein
MLLISSRLKANMRVHLQGDSTAGHFAAELLAIRNREAPVDPRTGLIRFPDHFCNIVDSMEALKNTVHFQTFKKMTTDHEWLCQRAISAQSTLCGVF